MLKKLLAAVFVVGTLGAAAPAFADWYTPGPTYVTPPPPVVVNPYYGDGYGYGYGYHRWHDRDDWRWRDRDDWRWRDRDDWRWRHRAHEWREHHRW